MAARVSVYKCGITICRRLGDFKNGAAFYARTQINGDTDMPDTTLVVGLDGSAAGERVLAFATAQAKRIAPCKLLLCYVIEWSPFSFQTPEENEQRHKRREEEISMARERVLDPAVAAVAADGITVEGIVRHGDAAEILEAIAKERGAGQIFIGRVGAKGLKERIFGGVSGRLVVTASVPVTIVP